MTFSFGECISGCKNFSMESVLLKSIATNPFYASLMITIIVLLVVMFTFRHVSLPKNESLSGILIRTGVYAYSAVLLIMFAHNHYMEQKFEATGHGEAPTIAGEFQLSDIRGAMDVQPTITTAPSAYAQTLPPPSFT
jgi:hypothetical protein